MSRLNAKHFGLLAATLLAVLGIALWLGGAGSEPAPDAGPTPATATPSPSPARPTRVGSAKTRQRKTDEVPEPSPDARPDEVVAGPRAGLTVRVVSSATHAALGGATVRVTDAECDEWEGQSDAEGVVRFDDVPAGATEVHAARPDAVPGARTLVIAKDAKETVEIALDPAAAVEGIVVDAKDGTPIASADVEAIARSGLEDRPLADGSTDESGRFRFAPLPTGAVVVVRASRLGFTRGEAITTTAAVGGVLSRVEVRLRRTGRVRGVTLDPDGRAMAGVSVRVAPEADPTSATEARFAESGPGGVFEVREVALGRRLVVVGSSRGWGDSEPATVMLTEDEAEAVQDLRLRDAARLTLTMTSIDGDVGFANVQVDDVWVTASRPAGSERVLVGGLTPGAHRFRVQARGFATVVGEFSVSPGENARIDVKLDRGVTISGIVVDRNGDPMPDVFVFASPVAAPGSLRRKQEDWSPPARSQPDGTFSITGLAKGRYDLFVFGSQVVGLVTHQHDAVRTTAVAPSSDVRVVAVREVEITLRVVLPPGTARTYEIQVSQVEAWIGAPNIPLGDGVPLPIASDPWIRDGVIRCTIAPRLSWLRVRAPGFAPEMVTMVPTELGTTLGLGEIRLHVGLKLRGRVVDIAGSPVAGTRVTTSADDGTSPFLLTKSDGKFEVEHLGPGPVVVRAETDGRYGAVMVPGADDAAEVVVVLRRMGILRGVVVDSNDVPVQGATVSIQHGSSSDRDPGRTTTATTDSTGTFAATVAAGPCRGTALVGGTSIPFRADVPEGAEGTVRVVAPGTKDAGGDK